MNETVTDYKTSGNNALDFTRYYNSRATSNTYATEFGRNWRDTYDRYLNVVSASTVLAERADGQVLTFTLIGAQWTTDSDIDVGLTHTGSGTGSTWTLTDRDGSRETYQQLSSGEGLLQSIQARDGYTQTMRYNTSHQLTSVIDSFNRTLTFTYQGGLLTTFTTPNGLVLTYGYSSSGLQPGVNDQLTSVSDTVGGVPEQWLYTYYQFGFLLGFIQDTYTLSSYFYSDSDFAWVYDSVGRGIASQMPAGEQGSQGSYGVAQVNYDDTTGDRTVTNALGGQEVYKFAVLQGSPKLTEIDRLPSQGVAAATELFTYDTNGYLASQTDWNGNLTTYVNDAHGRPISVTEASGSAVARTTTTTYDTTFPDLPDQVVAPRQTDTYTYDAAGNMLTKTETDTSGGSTNGQHRTWTYTYGSFGHVLTATGPRTDVTSTTRYTYDATNDVTSVTDPLGHITTYSSYNPSGLPLTTVDPNGVTTTYTYDLHDRLLTRTVFGAAGNATTQFSYSSITQTGATPTTITFPDGSGDFFVYDAAGKILIVYNSDDTSDIVYNRDANEDVTWLLAYPPDSGSADYSQTATYDAFGRLTQTIDGNGLATTYTLDADGNPIQILDPNQGLTTQTFDALNRLTSSTDPLGNTTTYTYDAQNNRTSVTDPRHLTTTYTYDGFGELIAQSSPDAGATTYSLDNDGNRISETDARGVVTNRTFDKLDRPLTETFPSSSENITYSYDAHSTTNFGVGRLAQVTDESGSTTYSYNERGDILSQVQSIGGKSYTTLYGYDLADHVSSVTYSSGHVITYTRNADGRITGVSYKQSSGSSTTSVVNATYLGFGPLATLAFGNGLTSTFTYDLDLRLTGVTTSGTAVVQQLGYTYDGDNNITASTDGLDPTRNQTFTYDADNRLTSATGKYGTLAFTYDADGNRTSSTAGATVTTDTYSATSNQLASTATGNTSFNYTYTADGAVTSDGQTTPPGAGVYSGGSLLESFTYGGRNLPEQAVINQNPPNGVTVASRSTTVTYQYNAFGQRALKSIAATNTATSYVYDTAGHLLAENNNTKGATTREYVWLDDLPVAQIEANGTIYYIHTDQLGAPQKMTNASQAVVWDRIDMPFEGTFSIAGAATDNLRGPGQYFDAESDLIYNWNRTLDPFIGRYTQADPMGLHAGVNLYAYAGDNPILYTDPFGLWTRQIGFAFNFELGTVNIQFGAGIAFDGRGNVGVYKYTGVGEGGGADAGAGISYQGSNADSICDLRGPFLNQSAAAGDVVGLTIDTFEGRSNGKTITGGGFTAGLNIGASFSNSTTFTWF